MLAAGLGIDWGTFATGGLFATVVVVTGTVVVGVGTCVVVVTGVDVVDCCGAVVVVGVVVEGTVVDETLASEARVRDERATRADRIDDRDVCPRTRRWWEPGSVPGRFEWVSAFVVVVTVDPATRLVDGATTLAMTGIAVVLNTTPAIRKLSDPMTTKRRGARRCSRDGSSRFFCPCV
jgi:hypothetical protein